VVEDDWKFGGFAGEIAAIIMEQAFDELDGPVARVCGADVPIPYAKELEQAALPQPQQIADAAKALL
jgi:pyruvate dehydrogenase E1 component beta subunit